MVSQSVEEFTLCRVCGEIADQSAFSGVRSEFFQVLLIILHDETPVLLQRRLTAKRRALRSDFRLRRHLRQPDKNIQSRYEKHRVSYDEIPKILENPGSAPPAERDCRGRDP